MSRICEATPWTSRSSSCRLTVNSQSRGGDEKHAHLMVDEAER